MNVFNGTSSPFMEKFTASLADTSIQWTYDREEKANVDFLLYVATSDLEGVTHIIDAVNDSNHYKEKAVFCTLFESEEDNFNEHQRKSLIATGRMVREHGGHWLENETDLLQFFRDQLTD